MSTFSKNTLTKVVFDKCIAPGTCKLSFWISFMCATHLEVRWTKRTKMIQLVQDEMRFNQFLAWNSTEHDCVIIIANETKPTCIISCFWCFFCPACCWIAVAAPTVSLALHPFEEKHNMQNAWITMVLQWRSMLSGGLWIWNNQDRQTNDMRCHWRQMLEQWMHWWAWRWQRVRSSSDWLFSSQSEWDGAKLTSQWHALSSAKSHHVSTNPVIFLTMPNESISWLALFSCQLDPDPETPTTTTTHSRSTLPVLPSAGQGWALSITEAGSASTVSNLLIVSHCHRTVRGRRSYKHGR